MLSIRQQQRKGRTKSQLLTSGGINEYYIDATDFKKISKLFYKATNQKILELLLKSLFTTRELADIARRIIIANMLLEGKSYDDIQNKIHAAKSTISLVKKSLNSYNKTLVKLITDTEDLSTAELYIKRRLKKGK